MTRCCSIRMQLTPTARCHRPPIERAQPIVRARSHTLTPTTNTLTLTLTISSKGSKKEQTSKPKFGSNLWSQCQCSFRDRAGRQLNSCGLSTRERGPPHTHRPAGASWRAAAEDRPRLSHGGCRAGRGPGGQDRRQKGPHPHRGGHESHAPPQQGLRSEGECCVCVWGVYVCVFEGVRGCVCEREVAVVWGCWGGGVCGG